MNTTTGISTAERLGRRFGRGWRAYARGERRVSSWLASKGMPVVGATVLLWVVKLAALGLLLYVVFWFVLLLVFASLVARGLAQNGQVEDLWAQKDELRHGEAGYGLYSSSGQRIDPHDPNSPYDE